ncbi:MAG: hypothetical protein COA58_10405 [Bacteroidetes bacterium]|nr:MAG: hypothetical protein COA58_10405 [Bacteroidota bacterium]
MSYAQFSGTNPASLTGRAHIYGSSLFNTGVGLNPRSLTIERSFPAFFNSTAPFEERTVGLRFIYSTPTNNTTKIWDVANSGNTLELRYASNNLNVLSLISDGRVGIGTSGPNAGLHIKSNESVSQLIETTGANNADLAFQSGTGQSDLLFKAASGALTSLIRFDTDNNGATMTFQNRYNGANEEFLKISGTGILYSKEIVVQATPFPDYVFKKDYKLMSLKDVETFINQKGHLPHVPSADKIEEGGMAVGKMQVIQMEKIEELYLHLIEMNKQIERLKEENVMLKSQL